MLTREEIEKALPSNLRSSATQAFTDMVNNVSTDQAIAEQVRANFISYTTVMRDGKFKVEDYLNAVTYVSYKLMGNSNHDAYCKTFPARHQALVAKGTSSKDFASYVSMFHRGKLVNLVMEQSLVPTWVLNQDMFQKALNVQLDLMQDSSVSPKVRSDAANSILTHLARPKDTAPLINIDMRKDSGLAELQDALRDLANGQIKAIGNGTTTKDVAGQVIVEAEQ